MNEVKTRAVPQIQRLRVQYFLSFVENETQDGVFYLKITEKTHWTDNGLLIFVSSKNKLF